MRPSQWIATIICTSLALAIVADAIATDYFARHSLSFPIYIDVASR